MKKMLFIQMMSGLLFFGNLFSAIDLHHGIVPAPMPISRPQPAEKKAWRVACALEPGAVIDRVYVYPGKESAILLAVSSQQSAPVMLILERRRREQREWEAVESGKAGLLEVETEQEDWGPWQRLNETQILRASGRQKQDIPADMQGTKYLAQAQAAQQASGLLRLYSHSSGPLLNVHNRSWEHEYRISCFVARQGQWVPIGCSEAIVPSIVYTAQEGFFGPMPRPMMAMGADMSTMAEAMPTAVRSMKLVPGHDAARDVHTNFMEQTLAVDFDEHDTFMIDMDRYDQAVLAIRNSVMMIPPHPMQAGVSRAERQSVRVILERQNQPEQPWHSIYEKVISGEETKRKFDVPSWAKRYEWQLKHADLLLKLHTGGAAEQRSYRVRVLRIEDDKTETSLPYTSIDITPVFTAPPKAKQKAFEQFMRNQLPVDIDTASRAPAV